MRKERISAGIECLDKFLNYLYMGDNVVWEVEAGTYIDVFIDKFIKDAAEKNDKVVYVSFNKSPQTISKNLELYFKKADITLLDCFTSGKGNNDSTFTRFYEKRDNPYKKKVIKIENPQDILGFKETLNRIEEEKGEKARYIFDSLTGMQDLWADEKKTYKFFTYSCPRLYDLETIAYWTLEKEAHTQKFRANIKHITQVAVELYNKEHQLFLRVNKAEGRVSKDLFNPQKYEVWDGEIVFPVAKRKECLDVGAKIKMLRISRNMSQRELAKKIGVTASFISQVERNLISPSIRTLIKLSVELKIDVVWFFTHDESKDAEKMITRKNQRESFALPEINSTSIKIQTLSRKIDRTKLQGFILIFEPNTEIKRHIYYHKGEEFFHILKGEVEVEIEGNKYLLHEGDSLHLYSKFPDCWRNLGDIPAQLIWILREN